MVGVAGRVAERERLGGHPERAVAVVMHRVVPEVVEFPDHVAAGIEADRAQMLEIGDDIAVGQDGDPMQVHPLHRPPSGGERAFVRPPDIRPPRAPFLHDAAR